MPNTPESPLAPARTTHMMHTLLVFRAPTSLSEELARVAVQEHTSVSAVIRKLLYRSLYRS
jgi:hypothetical protein